MGKQVKIEAFQGEQIKTLIPEIARLRIEVFQEYPFLYKGDEEYEKRYLDKFSHAKGAILVVAFDDEKIVGVSTGLPFSYESKEVQAPFVRAGLDPKSYFYFGESVLRKEYRGLKIGHTFFDLREAHARKLGTFSDICFCTVVRSENDPRRPKDYTTLEGFWKKRGYQKQPELTCFITWQEIDEKEESPKEMVFWTKKL